jgi:hypothetical protein
MSLSQQSEQDQNRERLSKPPFTAGSWACLAYVDGTYNPPGRKSHAANPDDFLGIYVSKDDPGVGLITFTGAGEYVAFHRCGEVDSPAEFAAIDAFIGYAIPFEQWRVYPVTGPEREALKMLQIEDVYQRAAKGIARLLHRIRFEIRPRRTKLEPMFLISLRSTEAILADGATEKAILQSLLGEEKAARHFEHMEKLKQRARQRGNEKDCADGNG